MAKYKIGDKVTVDCFELPNILCIQEIFCIECAAGQQIIYRGRFQGVDLFSGLLFSKHFSGTEGFQEHEITGKTSYEVFWAAHQAIQEKIEFTKPK